jgi:DNA-binding HxlR family transcriptional regulator
LDDSATLFEAISHPVRIKILKVLEKEPSSFASLKRKLGIESSGNLDHHLKKLGQLIKVQEDGLYALTDAGKEALMSITAIEGWREEEQRKSKNSVETPKLISVLAYLELSIAILAICSLPLLVSGDALTSIYAFLFGPSYLPFGGPVFLVISFLGFLSFYSIRKKEGQGWTVAIVQAVLIILLEVAPTYSAIQFGSFLSTYSVLVLLFVLAVLVLVLCLQAKTRAFLGKKFEHWLPRRVLIGGSLGLFAGALGVWGANMYIFASSSSVGGAGSYFLGIFVYLGSLLIALGGLLVLLRNYTLGGIILLVFYFVPIPFYYVAMILVTSAGYSLLSYIGVALLAMMPIVAGILALTSRPRNRS